MSTAGVHIPVRIPSSRPRERESASSKIWFILSWMPVRSRNGSSQRTIAIPSLLSSGTLHRGRIGYRFFAASSEHRDLLRFRLFPLLQADRKHAVPHRSLDLFRVNAGRNRKGTMERSVGALHPVVAL